MIIRVVRGTSFKACLRYLLKKPLAKVLMTHGLLGETPEAWLWELEAEAYDSTKVILPVYHLAIAVHPNDNPKATDDLFCRLAQEIVQTLRIAEHQWVLVRHFDTPHAHVHLMLNRVREGKASVLEYDHVRLQDIARTLETTYHLQGPKHRLLKHQLKLPKSVQPSHPPAKKDYRLSAGLPQWQQNTWYPWQKLLKALAQHEYRQGHYGLPDTLVNPQALSEALLKEAQTHIQTHVLPKLQSHTPHYPPAMAQALMYWLLKARLKGYAQWVSTEKQKGRVIPTLVWQVIHTLGWERDCLAKLLCATLDQQNTPISHAHPPWQLHTRHYIRLKHRARKASIEPKRRKPYMIDWGFRIGRAMARVILWDTLCQRVKRGNVVHEIRQQRIERHHTEALNHAYALWVHGVVSSSHPLVAWGMPIWHKTHWGHPLVRVCWHLQSTLLQAWLKQHT
ncbi:MAG: relaxase/mobilization nuclease domain-containing protein [Vampirovibrionales bacterium]